METRYDDWIGRTALASDGEKIGEIRDIYYDDVTGRPEWLAVKTGVFGSQGIVPIAGAQIVKHTDSDDMDLQLCYTRDQIRQAPEVSDATDHLDATEERELYAHYGFNYADRTPQGTYGKDYGKLRPDVDYPTARWNREQATWTAPGTETVGDRGEVVSEATATSEQVQKVKGTETVRLRKYQRTEMVPVTKEEIRVEKDVDPQGRPR